MDSNQKRLISIVSVLGLLSAILGPHFFASLLSLVTFIVIIVLFFKLRNPIFLTIFLALIFQWFQINIKIVYGNISNMPLTEQFSYYQDLEFLYLANTLSNIGLCFFGLGIYLPLAKKFKDFDVTSILSSDYSAKRIVRSYLIFSLGVSFLFLFRNSLPGINTIVVAVVKLKWGLLLITYLYVMASQESKKLFYTILAIEIFLGFTGYFSAFKDFIIIIVLSLLSIKVKLDSKSIVKFSFLFGIVLLFGLVWTAIKVDFREYLSGGTESQQVVVSKTDAVNKLLSEVSTVNFETLGLATNDLLDRISYIEFFSIVLRNVPEYMSYQDGKIVKESTFFYFKPRIFFPNKPIIDDSDHTNKYTNLDLVDDGQASHSIGFMTDAYIDFGPIGMMLLLSALGIVFGWSMKTLMIKSPNILWGLIYIVPFYFLLSVYSLNMMKVMGYFITYIVPIYLLRNIFYKLFDSYLRA